MRRFSIFLLAGIIVTCTGCHKRTMADFHFKPGLSAQDFEDKLGSPTREAGNWVGYTLADGNEVRLYFLQGAKGTVRTLTEADLFTANGAKVKSLFNVKDSAGMTQPATNPATTMPSPAPTVPAQ